MYCCAFYHSRDMTLQQVSVRPPACDGVTVVSAPDALTHDLDKTPIALKVGGGRG